MSSQCCVYLIYANQFSNTLFFCLIPFGIRHIVMCYDPAETGSWRGYYMTSLDRYQLKVGGWKYSVKKLNQYPWYSGVSDFFAGVRDFVLTAKMEDS